MDPEPQSSEQSSLQHLVAHDVASFGMACELSDLNLPTKRDILRHYFFLAERAKSVSKMFSYKTYTPQVADTVFEIWSSLGIELIKKSSISRKLDALLDAYRNVNKHKSTAQEVFTKFVESTDELLNIGKCQCNLKTGYCSCGSIPENLKNFMRDQNNDRNLTIPEHDIVSEETPSHIQGTERHVQLLAATAKRVSGKNVEGAMATTLESRKKTPRLESRQDFVEK